MKEDPDAIEEAINTNDEQLAEDLKKLKRCSTWWKLVKGKSGIMILICMKEETVRRLRGRRGVILMVPFLYVESNPLEIRRCIRPTYRSSETISDRKPKQSTSSSEQDLTLKHPELKWNRIHSVWNAVSYCYPLATRTA